MLPIPTPTSREALYQELWTRPIPELLNRYGVCELTFLTTCRRLHLPVPARHLWPRIAAGERFQPPPLSPWEGRRPPVGPIPLSDTEMARRMAVKAAAAGAPERRQPITVPDRLLDPHPLVKATARPGPPSAPRGPRPMCWLERSTSASRAAASTAPCGSPTPCLRH